MAARPIQILRGGVERNEAQVAKLHAQFRLKHIIRLRDLLDTSLLEFLESRLEKGHWKTNVHPGIREELVLNDLTALALLEFVTNQPSFRSAIEEITGIRPLKRFRGRIYRMIPGTAHHDRWHTDVPRFRRRVGMTLNLSSDGFRGGAFVLRKKRTRRTLANIRNVGRGDALIFRIDPTLEHRVTDVIGNNPKTAYAGWFVSNEAEYFDELNRDAAHYRRTRPKAHKPRTSRIE